MKQNYGTPKVVVIQLEQDQILCMSTESETFVKDGENFVFDYLFQGGLE